MTSKGSVLIDQDRCKGCNLCVVFCPQQCLALATDTLNRKGYSPSRLVNVNACTGCGVCAVVCPDVCITVLREPRVVERSAR